MWVIPSYYASKNNFAWSESAESPALAIYLIKKKSYSTCAESLTEFEPGDQPMLKNLPLVLFLSLCFPGSILYAQGAQEACARPAIGSVVPEPEDLRSHNGVLKVELTAHNAKQADGSIRYIDENGAESPTLRVNPGDLVVLTLKNDLTSFGPDAVTAAHQHLHMEAGRTKTPVPVT